MTTYQVDVSDPREDATGVVFDVVTEERRIKVHVDFDTLRQRVGNQGPIGWTDFVNANSELMQALVDQSIAGGWKGPLNWMM